MSSRPRAADDFEIIRKRHQELFHPQVERLGIIDLEGVLAGELDWVMQEVLAVTKGRGGWGNPVFGMKVHALLNCTRQPGSVCFHDVGYECIKSRKCRSP